MKIKKVLIPNRGEIAVRICKAAKSLGIKSVVAVSELDKDTWFAKQADEIAVLGPASANKSYLCIDKIIEAAKEHDCDAVHPGYGFLSENAQFAKAVSDAGLIFIGPDHKAIEVLGNKLAARAAMLEVGVPCTPGGKASSNEELVLLAQEIGFPVIVKAAAGGGGRGMRVAHTKEELEACLDTVSSEALKYFGSGEIYIELYFSTPRHVEVQVFGDTKGNIVHFGTRDCSVQRRHQKVIEEAPAPDLSDDLRERIHSAAIKAAKAVNYVNAGTVELLVENDQFFFLEMNTRIQVEHPVTEEVHNVDLVALQFKIANGEELPKQQEIKTVGHAFEFRVYAEDAVAGFVPSTGSLTKVTLPETEGVRIDTGVQAGDTISPFYDSMIAKVIVKGATRKEVIEKSRSYLRSVEIEGVKSNITFFHWLLNQSDFTDTVVDIKYLEREFLDKLTDVAPMLEAHAVKDPLYKGGNLLESYLYNDSKLTVLHRDDGVFVVSSEDGQISLSPCLATAIERVVEHTPK